MKPPEQVLHEIADGMVWCFNGHPEPWDEFEHCCKRACDDYCSTTRWFDELVNEGLPEDRARVFRALKRLNHPTSRVIISPLGDLSIYYYRRYSPFFTPRNLARFESKEEMLSHVPAIENPGIRLSVEDKANLEYTFNNYINQPIDGMHTSGSGWFQIGVRVDRETASDHAIRGVRETIEVTTIPRINFTSYLSELTGLNITAFEVETKRVVMANVEGTAKFIELKTLAEYQIVK